MSDLISREEAFKVLSEYYHQRTEIQHYALREALSRVPSVESKTAVWIGEGDGYADGNVVLDMWYCSNCDYCYEDDEKPNWNFCPNCGARMEGEEE